MLLTVLFAWQTQICSDIEDAAMRRINQLRRDAGMSAVRRVNGDAGDWQDVPPGQPVDDIVLGCLDVNVGQVALDATMASQRRLRRKFLPAPKTPFVVVDGDSMSTSLRTVNLDFHSLTKITSLRIREDEAEFTAWLPFRFGGTYTFRGGNGLRRITVELKLVAGPNQVVSDEIQFTGADYWPVPVKPESEKSLSKPELSADQEYPLVFPILGGVKWTDTWGAPRGGGTRKHEGQDLMAPKLRFVVAASDGVFWGNDLVHPDSVVTSYLHLNNDTPGTDDGVGGNQYYYAPGVYPGMKVIAGQHVGYVGDSGNAESTAPHLHFELHLPGVGVVNAAPSLRKAKIITTPAYTSELPEVKPGKGEVRWDAQVQRVNADGLGATVSIAARYGNKPIPAVATKLDERQADFSQVWFPLEDRQFLALIGTENKDGSLRVRRVVLIRRPLLSEKTKSVAKR
jgi:hypothetical protein